MRVGEGGEIAQLHHGRLQTMSARRAVFYSQIGNFVAHSFKKLLTCKHILPQSLAQSVRVVAAQTYRVVVVYLYIFKTVVAEHIYDLLLEIRLDRRK